MSIKNGLNLAALVLLSACTQTAEGANDFAQKAYDNAMITKERLQTYMYLKPYTKPVPPPIPERYCYRSVQDITCYETPLAGAEARLVGAQVPAGGEARVVPVAVQSTAVAKPVVLHAPPTAPQVMPFESKAQSESRWPKKETDGKPGEEKPLASVDVKPPTPVKTDESKPAADMTDAEAALEQMKKKNNEMVF